MRPVALEATGELLDHPVAVRPPEVGGHDHHDPIAFPVCAGGLLPAGAHPHLDVLLEQAGVFGRGGHGPDGTESL